MATLSITLGPVTVTKTVSAGNTTRMQNYAVARFGGTATEAANAWFQAIIDGMRAEVMEYERQQLRQAVVVTDLPAT